MAGQARVKQQPVLTFAILQRLRQEVQNFSGAFAGVAQKIKLDQCPGLNLCHQTVDRVIRTRSMKITQKRQGVI